VDVLSSGSALGKGCDSRGGCTVKCVTGYLQ
jgi:hypothetical protein